MELVIMANLACRPPELGLSVVRSLKRNPLGDTRVPTETRGPKIRYAEKAKTEKWLVRTNRKGQAVDTGWRRDYCK